MKTGIISVALLAATTFAPLSAQAHATLETQSAKLGSTHKTVIRISHGCDGQATQTVRVDIPEGFINVKPKPIAGWELSTVVSAYENEYTLHGSPKTEGVTSITWTGNLEAGHYEEFIFRGTLDESLGEGTLYLPTVQTCADGENAWVEIPTSADAERPEHPAPSLTLEAADDHAHHH